MESNNKSNCMRKSGSWSHGLPSNPRDLMQYPHMCALPKKHCCFLLLFSFLPLPLTSSQNCTATILPLVLFKPSKHQSFIFHLLQSLPPPRPSTNMGRSPCCEKVGIKKGPWTPEEDQKLLAYIEENGHGSWRALPPKAGLQRCGKSCRLRWTNYLRPDIKRGKFSLQEEQSIIQLHALLGNRWSAIATHLPKRTDNEIKNYWNTHLKKRLTKMGIDPVTHKPKSDTLTSLDGQSKNTTNLSHMAQWESARLEAEARLVRESKLRSSPSMPSINTTSFQQPGTCSYLDALQALQGICSKFSKGNRIDLESPTSTLSFSENNSVPIGCGGGVEVEEVDWKCFRKSTNIFDAKDDNLTNELPMLETSLLGGNMSWLHRSTKQGEGFKEMLLENNGEGRTSEFVVDKNQYGVDAGSDQIVHDEENKDYWDSIMNLVNSVPASSNSTLF